MSGVGLEPDLAEEEVLGERMLVFRERRRSLREVLDASLQYADREYLVAEERRLTFAQPRLRRTCGTSTASGTATESRSSAPTASSGSRRSGRSSASAASRLH
jgi:hypothetical protein